MANKVFFMIVVAAILALLVSAAAGQTIIQKEEADDEGYISALPPSQIDTSGTTPGPGSPTGKGRPPRVGPNRLVNDGQLGFPNGLFGRSETTSTGTTDGRYLVGTMPRVSVDRPLGWLALLLRFRVYPVLASRRMGELPLLTVALLR